MRSIRLDLTNVNTCGTHQPSQIHTACRTNSSLSSLKCSKICVRNLLGEIFWHGAANQKVGTQLADKHSEGQQRHQETVHRKAFWQNRNLFFFFTSSYPNLSCSSVMLGNNYQHGFIRVESQRLRLIL